MARCDAQRPAATPLSSGYVRTPIFIVGLLSNLLGKVVYIRCFWSDLLFRCAAAFAFVAWTKSSEYVCVRPAALKSTHSLIILGTNTDTALFIAL